jgi:HPr Serine kinase C-terminal domain
MIATVKYADRLDLETSVELAGLCCELKTNSPALIATVEAAMVPLPNSERRRPGEAPSFSIAIEAREDKPTSRHAGSFRGSGHLVFVSFGNNVFVLDLLRRQITASISSSLTHDREFWKNTLFPIALGVLGPAMGVAPLHCACVSMNGQGMLIAGISGAGKSTLAVALAQSGMELISDDWTYVSRLGISEAGIGGTGDNLRAYGLEVPVKLLPDAVEHFPQLRGQMLRRAMNGEMAFEVEPSLLQARCASWCQPSALVFLERRAQPGFTITAMERPSARAFFERSAERLPDILADAIRQRSMTIERVSSLPCFLLAYGGPPLAAAHALRNWHEERFHG